MYNYLRYRFDLPPKYCNKMQKPLVTIISHMVETGTVGKYEATSQIFSLWDQWFWCGPKSRKLPNCITHGTNTVVVNHRRLEVRNVAVVGRVLAQTWGPAEPNDFPRSSRWVYTTFANNTYIYIYIKPHRAIYIYITIYNNIYIYPVINICKELYKYMHTYLINISAYENILNI